MDRISSGIKGFDKHLSGGFPEKSVVLLSGSTGTGKTLTALSFILEGVRKGEKCCYVSLLEKEDELVKACENLKALNDVKKYLGKNLSFKYVGLDRSIEIYKFWEMFQAYPNLDRLVLDSLNKTLISAKNVKEYRSYLSYLVQDIKKKARSTLLINETDDGIDAGHGEAYECDGVIHLSFLEVEEKPTRTIEICKMRYTPIEPCVKYELLLDDNGIRLSPKKLI